MTTRNLGGHPKESAVFEGAGQQDPLVLPIALVVDSAEDIPLVADGKRSPNRKLLDLRVEFRAAP